MKNLYINRQLNKTPITINELRVGNIVREGYQASVVVGIDGTNHRVQVARPDIMSAAKQMLVGKKNPTIGLEIRIIQSKYLGGEELWGYQKLENTLPEFGFIREDLETYFMKLDDFKIIVKDCFYPDCRAAIRVTYHGETLATGFFWYLHELQNAIFQACRREITNNLIRSVLPSE